MKIYYFVVAAFGCGARANCAYGTSAFPRLPNVTISSFSYDGLKGPLNWFGLDESANRMCDIGTQQSPIVIDATEPVIPASSVSLTIQDYPNGARLENLGTNLEVIVNGSLVDTDSGTTFSLAQCHFHTPAEHRLAGEFFPMEMHCVFESEAKQNAVVAILVELCEGRGCGTPFFDVIFQPVNDIDVPGTSVQTGPLSFTEIIGSFGESGLWRYSGSLTTPPCSENVEWFISNKLLSIDLATWLAVKKIIKYNARYTQDILGEINLLENAAEELRPSLR